MKLTCVTIVLIIAVSNGSPIFREGNVESIDNDLHKEEDWQLVPDNDGNMHLIDINSVDMTAEPLFDAYNDVVFRLWTRANPTEGHIVRIHDNAQLLASNFNPNLPTRFHSHGWNGGGPLTGVFVRSALINHLNCNVFVVDWGVGAITANYILARNRVNDVGAVVAQYIDWINTHGVPFSQINVIGHSLGAHIAGAGNDETKNFL